VSEPSVVCAACGQAACWNGKFMCDGADFAGTSPCSHQHATDQESGWVCDNCGADLESD